MTLISGLQEIQDRYDAFIIDLFGVVHDGLSLFPYVTQSFEELHRKNKKICLLSNSPRRAKGAHQQTLNMGLPKKLMPDLITSGEATYHALASHITEYGSRCYIIGSSLVWPLLEGHSITAVENIEEADFILNCLPGTEQETVSVLERDLNTSATNKTPMICANPDLVVNIGENQHKCAGHYAQLYEELGAPVIYYGKPHIPVYEMAWERLGKPSKDRILAIGDSLHTDIQGANNFGIDSVLNLVGIHWEELQMDHQPGKPDLDKISLFLDSEPHKPTAVMCGFQW